MRSDRCAFFMRRSLCCSLERPLLAVRCDDCDLVLETCDVSLAGGGLTLHAAFEPPGRRNDPVPNKKRGEAAEAAFVARASILGFSVLHPWGESNRYDAALDLGPRMVRVQIKSATAFIQGYTIKTTGANGHVYTSEEIDFIAGYIVPEDIWYILPVETVGRRGTITFRPHSRRLKAPIYERYREAWCLLTCPRQARGWNDVPTICRSRAVGVQCAVCPLGP